LTRREALRALTGGLAACGLGAGALPGLPGGTLRTAQAAMDDKVRRAVERGLQWVAKTQSRLGHWTASGSYRVPMTALAGVALLCEGSTTTQGKYAVNIRRCTDYLISHARPNGLIGEPDDYRYTYGHGFSMLFLSQVLGEEEDVDRRETITEVLNRAVEFCCSAQTSAGGWGYVSAKDGNNFDEGSTTVTQVQGLRSCRNAGIPVPKQAIDRAIQYIYSCQMPDGGICYSSNNRSGSRPPITAAAVACLFNAGDYQSEQVRKLLDFCRSQLYQNLDNNGAAGHWFYTYYYYAQAMYRIGGRTWEDFRDRLYERLLRQQAADGSWNGEVGPIYATALSLTMLQLENNVLPVYQR
jgi:squalene cyclase